MHRYRICCYIAVDSYTQCYIYACTSAHTHHDAHWNTDSGATSTFVEPNTHSDPMPTLWPECPEETVNINTATIDQLRTIIHIDKQRAEDVIDERPFGSIEELTRVSGIGGSRLNDINEQGLACAGPLTQIMLTPQPTATATVMPEEYLTLFGDTKSTSVIVAEERARIEEHGYELVCVSGIDIVRSLMSNPPTADEARFLELMEELCAEYR